VTVAMRLEPFDASAIDPSDVATEIDATDVTEVCCDR
jgi:hypothetical protein